MSNYGAQVRERVREHPRTVIAIIAILVAGIVFMAWNRDEASMVYYRGVLGLKPRGGQTSANQDTSVISH